MRKKLCAAPLLVVLLCLFSPLARAEECEADRHQYIEVRRVPATAMEDGLVEYLCTVCEHEYTDILLATDHLWGDWVTELEPTCTEPGRKRRTCTRGKPHSETAVIPALKHDYKETRTEPTCLQPGKIVYVCVNDPAHRYEEPIPAPGSHSFGDWQIETPAGEGTKGLETRECNRCGFIESNVLDALPVATTEPPMTTQAIEPPNEPPRTFPVMDIVLVGANTVALGWFAFLLIPYFMGLAFARRRRKAIELRDELRREVDKRRGYE